MESNEKLIRLMKIYGKILFSYYLLVSLKLELFDVFPSVVPYNCNTIRYLFSLCLFRAVASLCIIYNSLEYVFVLSSYREGNGCRTRHSIVVYNKMLRSFIGRKAAAIVVKLRLFNNECAT